MKNKPANLPGLLTLREACQALNVHPNTIRQWDKKGILRAVRFGARFDRRYQRDEIIKLLHNTQKTNNHEQTENEKIRLIESAGVFMMTLDTKGLVTLVNKKTCDVLGYKREEMLGKNYLSFVSKSSLKKVKKFLVKVFSVKTNGTGYFENEVQTKGGQARIIGFYYSVLKNKHGKKEEILLAGEDITHRKREEEETAAYLEDFTFLSNSAMRFAEITSKEVLDQFIADQIRYLAGESLVVICRGGENETWSTVSAKKSDLETIRKIIKKEPLISFNLKGIESKRIGMGKIEQFSDNLAKTDCQKIKKAFNIKSIYTLSFAPEDDLGQAVIMTLKDKNLSKPYLIESFVNQVSVALNRQKAEETLHKYTQELKTLVENAPDIISRYNRDLHLTYINPAVEKDTGKPARDYLEKTTEELGIPQEVAEQWEAAVSDVFQTGREKMIDSYLPTLSGEKKYHQSHLVPEFNQAGEVETVLAISRDTTERIKADEEQKMIEEALRLSNEKTRKILESIVEVYFVLDKHLRFKEVNHQAELFWDKSRSELVGQKITDLFPHIKKTEFYRQYNQALKTQKLARFESFSERKKIWLEVYLYPVARELDVYIHDIDKRKRAEEDLRDSEARFRSVTQSAHDAIVSTDRSGRIISWNRGAEAIFGFSEKEILGKSLTVLMPFEFRELHRKAFAKAVTRGSSEKFGRTLEMRGLKKDGSEFPLELSLSSWTLHDQIYFTGIVRDITERRELEKRKDEFISIASHELKTPVTTIKGFTQILQRKFAQSDEETVKLYLAKMDSQLNNLTELVSNLLDVSRIQAGKLELRLENFEIGKLIAETIEDTGLMYQTHKISFLSQAKHCVLADRNRIAQVLINLISNAVKYSPPPSQIEIGFKSDGEKVIVFVRDRGIGISKDYHQKIFEPFFQAKGLGSDLSAGLGLGLHICSGIIERHGGKIWVKSSPRRGSTFFFSLPETKNNIHEKRKKNLGY